MCRKICFCISNWLRNLCVVKLAFGIFVPQIGYAIKLGICLPKIDMLAQLSNLCVVKLAFVSQIGYATYVS